MQIHCPVLVWSNRMIEFHGLTHDWNYSVPEVGIRQKLLSPEILLSDANTLSFKLIYPSLRVRNRDKCDTHRHKHAHTHAHTQMLVEKLNWNGEEHSGTHSLMTQKDSLQPSTRFLLSQVSCIQAFSSRITQKCSKYWEIATWYSAGQLPHLCASEGYWLESAFHWSYSMQLLTGLL